METRIATPQFLKKPPAEVRKLPLGKLVVPSGHIVCCDPFRKDRVAPFRRIVPPGAYHVELAIATGEEEWAAWARLIIRNAPASLYEMAPRQGEDLAAVGPDDKLSFEVESGFAAFVDFKMYKWMQAHRKAFEEQLDEAMGEMSAMLVLDRKSGANVIAFSAGYGDGNYASYRGLTADAKTSSLTVDFGVFP